LRSSEGEPLLPVQTRATFWKGAKRDTQTAWLEAIMREVYVTKAENKREDGLQATSFGTGNWLLDN
jgi:hypothetical protein